MLIILYFIFYKSEITFKNILFIIIIILIIYNFNNYKKEHLTTNEVVNNISQIFNSEKVIVKDLEITENLKVNEKTILNGNTTIDNINNLNSSNIHTDNINSLSDNSININNDIITNNELFTKNGIYINNLYKIEPTNYKGKDLFMKNIKNSGYNKTIPERGTSVLNKGKIISLSLKTKQIK
jgi:DNA replication protein DnaD